METLIQAVIAVKALAGGYLEYMVYVITTGLWSQFLTEVGTTFRILGALYLVGGIVIEVSKLQLTPKEEDTRLLRGWRDRLGIGTSGRLSEREMSDVVTHINKLVDADRAVNKPDIVVREGPRE